MNEHAVDQLLAAWEERLARVDESLLALESDATYQMVASARQRDALDGVTRARIIPALDALTELFEHRGALTDVLDRAKEIRRGLGFFDKQAKLAQIEELLTGPSIKLARAPLPLSRRNLLDPVESTNSLAMLPEHLLAAMAHAFEVARDAVMQVSRAWAGLEPLMAELERDVSSLNAMALEVGDLTTVGPELAAIDRDLAAYRVLVASDPLGVETRVEGTMGPRVEGVRQRLLGLLTSKRRVEAGLASADRALHELRDTHAQALVVPAKVRKEFGATPVPACVPDELLLGLDAWRSKIESTAHAGRWHAADVGLARWEETLRSYVASDVAAVRAFDALLATRVELSGRLSARRAQLQALVARGAAVDPSLSVRGAEAERLLAARPTNLAEAAARVDAFDREVVLVSKGRR